MNLSDGNHPIWNIIRLTVMMIALSVILYINASAFDQTEVKTIIFAFIAGGMGVGMESLVRALRAGKDNG